MQWIDCLVKKRLGHVFGFSACASLMGYALYLQYVVGLDPCPLCYFQRLCVIGMGVLFLLAALQNPKKLGAFIYAGFQGIIALLGIGFASRHLWIQSLPPDQIPSCGLGIFYMLDSFPIIEVLQRTLAGSGECATKDYILGMTIPAWTLLFFVLMGIWSFFLAFRRRSGNRMDSELGRLG